MPWNMHAWWVRRVCLHHPSAHPLRLSQTYNAGAEEGLFGEFPNLPRGDATSKERKLQRSLVISRLKALRTALDTSAVPAVSRAAGA